MCVHVRAWACYERAGAYMGVHGRAISVQTQACTGVHIKLVTINGQLVSSILRYI